MGAINVADILTIQDLANGHLDVKALGEAANGDENTIVTTRTGKTYPSAKKAIKDLFENGGLPATPFATKALMTASGLTNGKYAVVTNDVREKNGLYYKADGVWVASEYDAVAEMQKLISFNDNSTDIINILSSDSQTAMRIIATGDMYLPDLIGSVQENIHAIEPEYGSDEHIFAVKDANNKTTLAQLVNGDFLLPNIGNLTQALSQVVEDIDVSGSLLDVDTVKAANIINHSIHYLRIPAITRIDKKKYILFFEARNKPPAGVHGDFAQISSGSCIVTIVDNKPVVSNIIKIHESFIDSEGKEYIFQNPCGVLKDNGDIICMYIRCYPSDAWETSKFDLYMRISTDGGKSWGEVKDISQIKGGYNALCPCQQGFIKRYGRNKGRIIFPAWHSGQTYIVSEMRAGYIYSDDDGETWAMGGFVDTASSNEVQATQDIDGNIYLCVRVDDYSVNVKEIFKLSDGELSNFEKVDTNITLAYEPVMTGFIQNTNWFDGGEPKLILTTCKSTVNRLGLIIRISHDKGVTWQSYEALDLVGRFVGYTAVESIDTDLKLIVHENSGDGFSYKIISLGKILKGDK